MGTAKTTGKQKNRPPAMIVPDLVEQKRNTYRDVSCEFVNSSKKLIAEFESIKELILNH